MKLGAPILRPFSDAQQWIQIVQEKGYRAVFSPLTGAESDAEIDRYAAAARLAGVHYDPVNLVYSPLHYYNNGDYMKEFIKRLGSWIRSVHIKDVNLVDRNVIHLDEVMPGTGHLNYDVLLSRIEALDPDMPVLLEHFQSEEEYDQGERFIRAKVKTLGLTI